MTLRKKRKVEFIYIDHANNAFRKFCIIYNNRKQSKENENKITNNKNYQKIITKIKKITKWDVSLFFSWLINVNENIIGWLM